MAKRAAACRIRPGTAADAGIILAHRRAMFEDIGHLDREAVNAMLMAYAVWLRRNLRKGTYHAWFATTGKGEVVAGAGLWITEWPPVPSDVSTTRGYVANVYTAPAHRRKGLARRLLKALLAWCRKEGLKTVTLHSSDDGVRLYESLGFERTQEMRVQLPARRRK